MRFLWTLSNSIVAGALGALYVIVLVLLLNPAISLGATSLLRLVLSVGAFYAVHLMAIVYALLAFRQLFGRETFSSAWVSLSVLVLLALLGLFFTRLLPVEAVGAGPPDGQRKAPPAET